MTADGYTAEAGQSYDVDPIRVILGESIKVEKTENPPIRAAYKTVVVSDAVNPVKLLNKNPKRVYAYIEITGNVSSAVTAINKKSGPLQNGGSGYQFRSAVGDNITLHNGDELYAILVTGTSNTLSIFEEWYDDTDTDE